MRERASFGAIAAADSIAAAAAIATVSSASATTNGLTVDTPCVREEIRP